MPEELMGVGEIAECLSLSRQRVNRLFETDPSFPRPVTKLKRGRVWRASEIEAWAATRKDRRQRHEG
jgi:predicted DNA-binding transcriptional regulator AlpA